LNGDSVSRWKAELALVAIAFVWGSTFVLVKTALEDISTLLFLALRFLLAALVLGAAYRRRFSGFLPGGAGRLWGGVLTGLCLFGGYVFQTLGLRLTTPSKSAFLTGLAIPLVPLLASLFWRIPPKLSELAGVAVATAGMALMTLPGGSAGINLGDLLTLGAAFFFAVHLLAVGHFSPRDGFERLSVLQVTAVAVLSLASFWWAETMFVNWSYTLLAAIAVTALMATAAALTVQAWAQRHTSFTRTAVIFAAEPVFAAATSFVVLGEVLTARAWAGAGLILAGILIVELKPFAGQRRLVGRTV
jgi:drug/metabolite transporter (DMT)-like permease